MTRPATSDALRRQALERDGQACVWPAHPPTPPVGYTGALQVDHITELADGGTDTLPNLQTLCDYCHGLKSRERQRRRAKEPRAALTRPIRGTLSRTSAGEGTTSIIELPAGSRSALSGRTARPGQAGISPRRHFTHAQFEQAAARRAPENYAGDEAC